MEEEEEQEEEQEEEEETDLVVANILVAGRIEERSDRG
jgi:ribosomal protein L11 methylase PrmA